MSDHESFIDSSKARTFPIADRRNLVDVRHFARVVGKGSSFSDFLDSLPTIKHRTNSAQSLRMLVERACRARDQKRVLSWAIGPHVIKYGLAPLIFELMDRGFITNILFNGASAIHDAEIALIGETSEEMEGAIVTGSFGMARETGEILNGAACQAYEEGMGFGRALGRYITEHALPYSGTSILAGAYQRAIPVTVHVAYGTDIVHMHPNADGAWIGKATELDFRKLAAILQSFSHGFHINIASTVVLPEVFIKSLTLANNVSGTPAQDYITFHLDHLSEYRPLMNVVRRATSGGGEGHEIIGRVEIMVPLVTRLLLEQAGD